MFGRKKPETPKSEPASDFNAPPLKLRGAGAPATPAAPAAPTSLVAPVQPRYEIPKRASEAPTRPAAAAVAAPVRPEPAPAPALASEGKRLLVGRDIVLSGEITTCDQLVVEGRVEAALTDTRVIEIRETGYFKGNAEIDEAEIRGVFEGDLTVRNRLLIRATGKVTGQIRYGMLEIECGGQLSGDIQIIQSSARPAAASHAANGLDHGAESEDDLLDGETESQDSWQIPARQ
ncbi:MAG: polymer-forming cytoskeletal protein [Reyranellaceae bacterium]